MDYIDRNTKQVKSLGELRAENGASIPEGQAYGDMLPILPSEPPVPKDGQVVVVTVSQPVELDGQWYMGWAIRDMTQDEIDGKRAAMRELVNQERDRRIEAGFTFAGVQYQYRHEDREVYNGKVLEAHIAIMNGALPGNLRWYDRFEDFAWIAADNSRVPMDSATVIELGKAASAHCTRLTFAASDIKALEPIPDDYAEDARWPSRD